MANGQTTTYPKAKLASIKKLGAVYIARSILTDLYYDTEHEHPIFDAEIKVGTFTTRQLYQFLRDNGYTFNVARAIWQAAEVPE